jgi:hypothetical protein
MASVRDFIILRPQDQSQFQQRIDDVKPREPQPGDKQTSRQKRFKEQEVVRNQEYKDNRDNSAKKYEIMKNMKIDKFEENIGKTMKKYEKQLREVRLNRELFQKSKDLSSEISGWKRTIEHMQRNEVSNFPDLMKKCNDLKNKLKDIHNKLDISMEKKFGLIWKVRNVKYK